MASDEQQLTGREWKAIANLVVIADQVHHEWRNGHGTGLVAVELDNAMWELEARLGNLPDRLRERIYGERPQAGEGR